MRLRDVSAIEALKTTVSEKASTIAKRDSAITNLKAKIAEL